MQDTVLESAQDEGLLVDLAMGPNQGAGVPALCEDDGLLWDLAPFSASLSSSTSTTIPGWGGGAYLNADSLVAAVVGRVASQDANGTQVTLAADSLQDVTSRVNATDGSLRLDGFLNNATDDSYVLFTFYQEHAAFREVVAPDMIEAAVPQSPVQHYRQNGSWVVDHFSAAGAQVIIDFWNSSLLAGNTTEALAAVGNYLWQDSQEYGTNNSLFWTPKFPEAFASRRGYNISTWLPVIVSADLAGQTTFGGVTYTTDEADAGLGHIEDYEQTVSSF